MDAPWRPADVEQREGRALRPGNLNPSVEIFRYVSERSFDSFMWQTLERKARFIGQVLGGRASGRDVDDIGDATLSYAEVKALATGNPLLLELAEANADVMRLRQLASGHTRAARRLATSVTAWEQQIDAKTRLAETCDRVAAVAQQHHGEGWRDHLGNPIPAGDVPGHLGALAGRALASSGYAAVTWRRLRITFSAERNWRQIVPVATVAAGLDSLTVDLNPAWAAKGQHWRIERELTARIDGAATEAGRLRTGITDLRQRVADATTRINEPFPQAAELEAARARRDGIEQQIRDAAAPPGDTADAPPGSSDERDARPVINDFALTGLDGDHEVTVFSRETAFVFTPETAPFPDFGRGENSPEPDPAVAPEGDAIPILAPAAAWDESVAPDLASTVAAGTGIGPPEADGLTASSGTVTAGAGTVPPGVVVGEPEPLFEFPEPASRASSPATPFRIPRPRNRSPARRTASQLAANDGPAQPVLFDLASLPPAAPGRKPGRSRASTPRR